MTLGFSSKAWQLLHASFPGLTLTFAFQEKCCLLNISHHQPLPELKEKAAPARGEYWKPSLFPRKLHLRKMWKRWVSATDVQRFSFLNQGEKVGKDQYHSSFYRYSYCIRKCVRHCRQYKSENLYCGVNYNLEKSREYQSFQEVNI